MLDDIAMLVGYLTGIAACIAVVVLIGCLCNKKFRQAVIDDWKGE